MENRDLERLPDPNTFDGWMYRLPDYDHTTLVGETVYYIHEFVDEKENLSRHWSKKQLLPHNATLDDL